MLIYSIYRILNLVNLKSYVGQTINPETRQYQHFNCVNSSEILSNAIKKYGKENFQFTVIYQSLDSFDHIMEMEKYFIEKYNSIENGYNLSEGGYGSPGVRKTEETKQKIREKAMGRKHTEATKKKLSQSHKGYVMPERQKAAISSSLTGHKRSEVERQALRDRVWTPEMREKARLAQLGKKHSPEALAKLTEANQRKAKRYLITKPDGSQETITNLNQFCKDHGLKQSSLSAQAHGRMKSPHCGFFCNKKD